jgi:ferric-dicitrate binding protein FerR (iron transport regulator)
MGHRQRLSRELLVAKVFLIAIGAALTLDGLAAFADEAAVTDLEARGAWKEGRLEYRHTPLKIVIPSVNVHSGKLIVLADDTVGNLLFSGTVFEGQVTDWLRALTITLPIVVIEGDDRILICMRRDTEGSPAQGH